MTRALPAVALLTLTACVDPASPRDPEEEPFAFETARPGPVSVAVTVADGQPLRHAHVTVRAVPTGSTSAVPTASTNAPTAILPTKVRPPAVLWSGVARDGLADGTFSVPPTTTDVDLIVHAPGYRGPCPPERCAPHGAFAPAAWIRTTADALAHTVVTLEEVPR